MPRFPLPGPARVAFAAATALLIGAAASGRGEEPSSGIPPATMNHSATMRLAATRDSIPAPPVDSLLLLARRGSPDRAALQQRLTAAKDAAAASGGLRSLRVGLMLSDAGFPDWTVGEEEMSMIGPEFELVAPLPGAGRSRREALEAAAGTDSARLEGAIRRIDAQIRREYAAIYAVDRQLSAHRVAHDLLAAAESSRRGRIAAGDNPAATLEASLAIEQLNDVCDDLERQRLGAMESLRRLIGDATFPDLPGIRELTVPDNPPAAIDSLAAAGSPEVLLALAEVRVADREAALARAMRKPELVVEGGWGFRGNGSSVDAAGNVMEREDVAQLRVGVMLPGIAGLETGPAAAAGPGRLAAANADLAAARHAARARARRLVDDWKLNDGQIRRITQVIEPLAKASFDEARSGLVDGRSDLSPVLDSLARWIDARAMLARREAERFALGADLVELIGESR